MKMIRKRATAIIIIMLIAVFDLGGISNWLTYEASAATFDQINTAEVFLKQKNGDKQCTLVAATMLIRRAAMLSGNESWADITVDKVKEQAWIDGVGLRYSFAYAGIKVNKAAFGSDPVKESIKLLSQHPEGIVLYDQKRSPRSHAVLLTDYTNEVFYSADPAEAIASGRILNTSALVQVKDGESYWYVSSPQIPPASSSATEAINTSLTIENNPVKSTTNNASNNNAATPTTNNASNNNTATPTTNATNNNAATPTTKATNNSAATPTTKATNNNAATSAINTNTSASAINTNTATSTIDTNTNTTSSILETLSKIKLALSKQTIDTGGTAAIKVTLPDSLVLVKEYSGNSVTINKEVKVSYTSDNKKIATVNSSGRVTGKKKGTTKINVIVKLKDGTNKTFSLKIKVKEQPTALL